MSIKQHNDGEVENNQQESNLDESFLANIFEASEEGSYHILETPAHLSKALYAIPKASNGKLKQMAPWLAATSIAASTIFAFLIFSQVLTNKLPEQEALQARQDFIVAIRYLQKANAKATNSIQFTLKDGLDRSTAKPLIKTIYNSQSS